jgi:hypothetical protein
LLLAFSLLLILLLGERPGVRPPRRFSALCSLLVSMLIVVPFLAV